MIPTLLTTALVLLGSVEATEGLLPPRAIKLTTHRVRDNDLAKRGYGVAGVNRYVDLYAFDVKIGTPAQTVRAYLDESRPFSAFYGRPSNDKDPGFLASKSSTYKAGANVNQGEWGTDKITFGNETRDDIAFQYINKDYGNDASWGFGFPSAEYNVTSFWQTSSANWTDKQVGLFLSRHREAPKDDANQANRLSWKDSEVMVGGVNKDKINGDIKYFSFTPNGEGGWPIPLEGITVNGKVINMTSQVTNSSPSSATSSASPAATSSPSSPKPGIQGHVSLSTTCRGPSDVVQRIYEAIPGAHLVEGTMWAFPCNTTVDTRVTIGGQEYAMKSVDMVAGIDPMYGGWQIEQARPNYTCAGVFQGTNTSSGWYLGTPFLKNVYTVFQYDPPAVGFGQLSDKAQPVVKPSAALRNGVPVAAVLAAVAAVVLL